MQGHYTIANLQAFEQYHARTSWFRAALVCALTPVPCLILLVLTDTLPLEPPARGPRHSPNVWLRTFFTVTEITICILQQLRQHLPALALRSGTIATMSLAAATSSVVGCYAVAHVVGFPVPFHMIVGTLPWGITVAACLLVFRGRTLASNRELAGAVRRYLLMFFCQISMTVAYPVFSHIYSRLPSTRQTAFVLLLPVIKIVVKNGIGRTLPDSDDAKPEAAVFTVEIFHALFVSLCMGSTTSPRTVVAQMAVDLAQALLSFSDIKSLLDDLELITAKLARARERADVARALSSHMLEGLLSLANGVIVMDPSEHRYTFLAPPFAGVSSVYDRLSRGSRIGAIENQPTAIPRGPLSGLTPPPDRLSTDLKMGSVVPESRAGPTVNCLDIPKDLATLNVVERGVLVRQTQKLLFVTEFLVLVEYTEVIMPWIYTIYVVGTWFLPNRAYYPLLAGIHTMQDLIPLIANVQLYAALEFVSLVMITAVAWWKLRISLLHQLAFVLETRAANVQAKLLLWVLYTMQTSIVQLGVDYTFHFAWLHSRDKPRLRDTR